MKNLKCYEFTINGIIWIMKTGAIDGLKPKIVLADNWSKDFPQYGFEKNRGYGTKEHLAAIDKFGFCPLHRKSFNPVKTMLEKRS